MGQNLSTFSKQFWSMLFVYVCRQTPVFPTGAVGVGNIVVYVIKVMRSNAILSGIIEKRNENDIEAFLKMLGSFKKYINVKTLALHLHF